MPYPEVLNTDTVLTVLRNSVPKSIGMLSDELGVSYNTVKRKINSLIESGKVAEYKDEFHKTPKLFHLTEGAKSYRLPRYRTRTGEVFPITGFAELFNTYQNKVPPSDLIKSQTLTPLWVTRVLIEAYRKIELGESPNFDTVLAMRTKLKELATDLRKQASMLEEITSFELLFGHEQNFALFGSDPEWETEKVKIEQAKSLIESPPD